MVSEWRRSRVADLQREGIMLVEDGNHGEYRPRPDEFISSGVAFIRAADMDNGRVLFDVASKINECARQRITKGIGAPGDVLLSHKGTVGKIAFVPMDAPPFVCSPQTTLWRALKPDVLDGRYLYVYMRSPEFSNQLAARAGETDMAPYVSLTSQRGFEVLLPPIKEQRAIADVIGSLDDKIDLNRRMNDTLEAMARALFKSWFVDFDPVRAKAQGEAPESICGRLRLTPDLLDLFPDNLVDSGFGEVPAGWLWSSIGDQVDIVGGGTPSTKDSKYWDGGSFYWTTPKDLSGNLDSVLLKTERKITQEGLSAISSGLLPLDTVLLSSRAPVGYLAIAKVPTAINQGFIAMKCNKLLTPEYVLQWANSAMDEIKQRASGTTFAEISKKSFRTMKVVAPTSDVMREYTSVVRAMYDKIVLNISESESLGQIRDLLLPKLLNGDLLVKEAIND